VLGGRIGYVLFYVFDDFIANPMMLLRINEGGMSFHGGLLGVMIAAAWWTRKHRRHFFDVMDFVAPLIPLGLGFGRLGNYIGGELWGKPTGGDWGVVFRDALPTELAVQPVEQLRQLHASGALDAYARHPSQLYQAFLEGVVLMAALWLFSRKPRPRYAVSGLFALLYGTFRFLVEFVREPDAHLGYLAFGWLTMGQVLSLPLVLLGLFLLWKSHSAPTLQPDLSNVKPS
jgi:phosphatidylglycerol:prolipoprotein diacylglycerol transferase